MLTPRIGQQKKRAIFWNSKPFFLLHLPDVTKHFVLWIAATAHYRVVKLPLLTKSILARDFSQLVQVIYSAALSCIACVIQWSTHRRTYLSLLCSFIHHRIRYICKHHSNIYLISLLIIPVCSLSVLLLFGSCKRGDQSPLYELPVLFFESVAIGKPERQVRKASHCGSKQQ